MEPRRAIPDFTEKVNWLFGNVKTPAGGSYTQEGVAQRATELGYDLKRATISNYKTGRLVNPTIDSLRALSEVFGVGFDFWFDEDARERTEGEVAIVRYMRTADPRLLVVAQGLSVESVQALLGTAQRLRSLEGLPPAKFPNSPA